ncbi:hypothetical protein KFL_017070020, partial [Klebsormidium nitens]
MLGYYRISIPRFAQLAKPLHDLTKIGAPWEWGPHQMESFRLLKQALNDAQALTRPDFAKPFILDTDYSKLGIGATLSQLDTEDSQMDAEGGATGSPVKMTWEDSGSDQDLRSVESSADELERLSLLPRKLFSEESETLGMEEELTFRDWAAEDNPMVLTILAGEVIGEPTAQTQAPITPPAETLIEEESTRRPSGEEDEMVEQLTRDLDRHLGWDAQQILEAATREGAAELEEPEGFDADVLQVLKRRRNFERNGGLNTPLAESTLVERVAITILTSCPTADPEEVLKEAKKAILNMRQDCRENVIAAVRENLRARCESESSEGIAADTDAISAAQLEAFSLEDLSLKR